MEMKDRLLRILDDRNAFLEKLAESRKKAFEVQYCNCAVVQITCLTVCYPEYATPLFPLLTLHYSVGNYVMTLRLEPRTSTIWQTFQSSRVLSIYNYANNSTSLLCCIICMKKLWIDRNFVSKQIPFPSFSTEDVALAHVYT